MIRVDLLQQKLDCITNEMKTAPHSSRNAVHVNSRLQTLGLEKKFDITTGLGTEQIIDFTDNYKSHWKHHTLQMFCKPHTMAQVIDSRVMAIIWTSLPSFLCFLLLWQW
jgi:hypothetical protein